MTSQDKTISFAYRPGNEVALVWEKKITRWLKKNYPNIKVVGKNGKITIVLGGDGTILETARRQNNRSLIFGLNLGRVGFLASVRESKNFLLREKKGCSDQNCRKISKFFTRGKKKTRTYF